MKKEQEIENFQFFVSVDEIKKEGEHKFKLVASSSDLVFLTTVLKFLQVSSEEDPTWIEKEDIFFRNSSKTIYFQDLLKITK